MSQFPTPFAPSHTDWSDTFRTILKKRGLDTPEAIAHFLSPRFETGLHDPFLMHDMDKAVTLLKETIKNGEHITIFSDYDCDGIPGAVVFHDFLKTIGHTNFSNYIPHRHYEGFGLSVEAVEKIHQSGTSIIITIDCGTTDTPAIVRAKELGIKIIVTDHHEPPEVLPPADAIVNPKLGNYPFPELCGAGVIFKVVQALLFSGEYNVTPGQEKWWLDMVGLATIADMVPLVGENRVFAHYGLLVLRKSRRPGLKQLLKLAKANQAYLTEEDIGFTIAPRINAASRMDAPEQAFALLTASTDAEALQLVEKLESLNTSRKSAVAQITKELHQWVKELSDIPPVLVYGNPSWRPSLVGLAAAKLAEEYGKPVFLWGRDGNQVHKGSCRSGGGVSVVELMRGAADIFLEHGGHHFSGGFSLRDESVFSFGETLNRVHMELGTELQIKEVIEPDADITLEEVFGTLRRELAALAPFGVGNPRPLFSFPKVTPTNVSLFGKANEHTKLTFSVNGRELEAIAFFTTPKSFTKTPSPHIPLTLHAHIEESYFMGRHQLRLRIVDIL
ncbi:MAG: single-stranded-DNA-specific exonuclease RecJ [Candidatus Pacebacteria bacterium]|nr:single-stranded-DNA-specific exonuclease RecJ [Candidatus Paceibacterota bacterium]